MLFKNRSVLRGFTFPSWSIPIALLILTLLSYGLRALSLGFFWDDWPYLWFFHRFGAQGIIQAFAGDRPFLSFIYILSLSILRDSTQAWQIFALLARWLCSLGLWWMLALTWPRYKNKTAWAAFLFAVYPGFTQQWIAVIYGQAFFLFAAMFFSIGVTLWLARRRRTLARGWIIAGTLLALALSAFTMFSTEYFFGLELLRPMLLWLVLGEDPDCEPAGRRVPIRQRILRTAAWWSPYLALMLTFVIWRGFIHTFPGYRMSTLENVERSPLKAVWDLALTIAGDFIESTLVAWGQSLQIGGILDTGSAGLRLLAVIVVTSLLVAAYLAWLRPRPALVPEAPASTQRWIDRWAVQAILVGILAMLIAGWPFWITRLPLKMGFPQDRFTLAMAVGACLLLAGLIDAFGGNLVRKAILLGLVIGLAVGFHFNLSLAFREDWNTARDFFWQLTWRAPSIQPNTLIVTDSMPFRYFEDDSLTGPLNWTFDPNGHSSQMGYLLNDLYVRYHSLPPLLKANQRINRDFRTTTFTGSTSQVLLVYYAPPGCVRILDPVYDKELYRLPDRLLRNLPASSPAQFIQDSSTPAVPPEKIFGSEPKHRWCYFLEKADLARQNKDWLAIIQLSNDSIRKGYRPEDPAEYLPFIEGYTQSGYWEDAYQLTETAYQNAPALRPALCASWKRSAKSAMPKKVDITGGVYTRANNLLACPAP